MVVQVGHVGPLLGTSSQAQAAQHLPVVRGTVTSEPARCQRALTSGWETEIRTARPPRGLSWAALTKQVLANWQTYR
jgi:hypothetical protein